MSTVYRLDPRHWTRRAAQKIKPSMRRLIWEFSGRDADFSREFRQEMAQWVRCMWRIYGHEMVRKYTVQWAQERFRQR